MHHVSITLSETVGLGCSKTEFNTTDYVICILLSESLALPGYLCFEV